MTGQSADFSEDVTRDQGSPQVRRQPSERSSERRQRATRRQALRVLVIEDNPGDVQLVRERMSGHFECEIEVSCSPHLETGLARLSHDPFDALIVDLNLPDATPTQTLALIRDTRDSVAVIVLTGSSDESLRREALRSGAQEYLVKGEPATLVLGRCVAAAVERHRGQSVQRQLERWISVTPDAIVVTRKSGEVEFVNRAALDLFGCSDHELFAENLCFAADGDTPAEIEVITRGERRSCDLRVVPIEWNGSHAVLATIRDQTERRRAEAQLAAVDRLVTIGTLAASVVHEINNPVAAMIVNLELAAREAVGRPALEELQQLIGDAREAADRVRAIAGDLRTLSRATEERLEWINLQDVVATTLRLAAHETRSRAAVVVELDPALPLFKGHASRLGQVLLNLVVNAAQAIGDGAHANNTITIGARARDHRWVELFVQDTGSGMKEEVRRKLFTPFFTSKPASLGTGLGLSICQRIVQSYGGAIEVESRVGVGTTFRVLWPIAPSVSVPPAAVPGKLESPQRPHVLVVDDDVLLARAVARALKADYEVEVAHCGASALVAMRRPQAFDVVLCDVTMPDMTGADLYDQVRVELPKLVERFVFFTGGVSGSRALARLAELPNQKLDKPLNIGELSSLVGEAVRAARS